MIEYVEPVYRPPSEADSLILQATIGCSFNRCSFCSMYRGKEYRPRPLDELLPEIDRVARRHPEVQRVFLADGDAFTLPTDHLLTILERLDRAFPRFARAGAYAWPMNVYRKTDAELARLREARLAMAYVGLESGSDRLLRRITKGSNAALHGAAIDRLRAAGIRVSATLILGLGGRRHSKEHVRGTIELASEHPPNFLSTLQLGIAPEIAEEFHRKFGEPFEPLDDLGMLAELREIAGIELRRPIVFRSTGSNALRSPGTSRRTGPVSSARSTARSRPPLRLRAWRVLRPPGRFRAPFRVSCRGNETRGETQHAPESHRRRHAPPASSWPAPSLDRRSRGCRGRSSGASTSRSSTSRSPSSPWPSRDPGPCCAAGWSRRPRSPA
ncbi:MAG: radical SAM protein [Planctomycetota bacterium]